MKLYNTSSKEVQEVKPQKGNHVTVYTCGPTVYDKPHIGNWFTFIRYDLLVRTLRLSGLEPEWVMNITDVGHLVSDADEGEDKLEKGARREGKTAWDIAKLYTDNFTQGLEALNSLQPDKLPRATDHIQEQIDLIKVLETKGFTYIIDDGVYYDTSKFPTYADFAHLDLAGQQQGTRIEVNTQKKQPTDFALWKFSPKGQQRDMEWDSPWGKGFPGWHIECSAMSMKYLGETIDVHAGGIDHIPVHHSNEIAQSEAATGEKFVNYWMHTNHILINDEKIAKSHGSNAVTLEDIQSKNIPLLALRMLVLESHYRTQSVFTWDVLQAAAQRLQSLEAVADLVHQPDPEAAELGDAFAETQEAITKSLLDDLNTPEALSALSSLVSKITNNGLNPNDISTIAKFLQFIDQSMGFKLADRRDLSPEQKAMLEERATARQKSDWKRSDEIRDKLQTQGITVSDHEGGWTWHRTNQ